MLEVRDLSAVYGQHPALQNVSLSVSRGELVVILGANGAGKTTLLRAISGICEGRVSGEILLDGQSLAGLSPDRIVERGVVLVPEGRGIFGELSVRENLLLGSYCERARGSEAENLDRVMQLFPQLHERRAQIARTMSGGEQQMVAVGRAMMSAPVILVLDEPSLGLSPLLCKEFFQNLAKIKSLGIGVLLVEQNARQSLAIADRGYLLENTRIVHEDNAASLASDPVVQKAYLGAGSRIEPKTPETESDEASEVPAGPEVGHRPTPRRTADEHAGLDIDELAQSAARRSEMPFRPSSPSTGASRHEARLAAAVQDIRRAAADARQPVRKPGAGSEEEPPGHDGRDAAPVPVIEIYRRPRVEVYRRRPSGKFERD